jgi:hypothetical protein
MNKRFLHSLILTFVLWLLPCTGIAQDSGLVSLSVTPTLFEMSANPQQAWNSSVKVINNNPQELVVYAQVVNFAPQGETGQGKFVPVFESETHGATLAEWISITSEPFTIAPEQSVSIPFNVQVPPDAAPGGHFAAILIGTQPPDSAGGYQVKTSQIVTSLFFVRVAGDVVEEGVVREFRTVEKFVDAPEAQFEVRFENKGNVHLQPQGEILITNMWGKERGVIPINHQTHFGNVLPESVRKFEFSWRGETTLSDIGRYKAVLALAYGEDARKFATSTVYFYVIPLKALVIVLGSLIAIIALMTWAIKAYVRRMLALAGVNPDYRASSRPVNTYRRDGDVRIERRVSLQAPVQSGVLDLKKRLEGAHAMKDVISSVYSFIIAYRVFFLIFVLCVISIFAIFFFVREVTQEQRDYEVVIENTDADVTLSSEEIIYEKSETESVALNQDSQQYSLVLINASDTPGLGASLQGRLESEGYVITSLRADLEEVKERTVIVYDTELQEEALALSKLLKNALLSANTEIPQTTPQINVFIGNDLAF